MIPHIILPPYPVHMSPIVIQRLGYITFYQMAKSGLIRKKQGCSGKRTGDFIYFLSFKLLSRGTKRIMMIPIITSDVTSPIMDHFNCLLI